MYELRLLLPNIATLQPPFFVQLKAQTTIIFLFRYVDPQRFAVLHLDTKEGARSESNTGFCILNSRLSQENSGIENRYRAWNDFF